MRFLLETTASPETAFIQVADFANLENWDPFVGRSWCEGGEPLTEGAVYMMEAPWGLRLEYRIIDAERPRFVVYQGGTKRVRSTDAIEVAGTRRGSRVTVTSDLSFRGWMKMISPLIAAMVWLGGRLLSVPAMQRHLRSLS